MSASTSCTLPRLPLPTSDVVWSTRTTEPAVARRRRLATGGPLASCCGPRAAVPRAAGTAEVSAVREMRSGCEPSAGGTGSPDGCCCPVCPAAAGRAYGSGRLRRPAAAG
eukprot:scaffold27964_cov64-Phaeocystis_antarctica.AAC.4